MSGIGIDIQAKFQSVVDAKKQIQMLGTSLKEVQGLGGLGDIGFEPSQSERVKEMVSQVNRLNTIAGQGERKGGFLSKQQFQEASRMMQQLTKNVQEYGRELENLKRKHAELGREERVVLNRIATGGGNADDIRKRNEIRRQRNDIGQDIDRLQKDEDRINRVRRDAMHAQGSISGMDQQGNSSSGMKKALGFALAAAGVGGPLAMLFGFLSKSRATYQQAIGHESTLGARGITGGFGDNIGIGMGPLEQMALLENISQTTGMSGNKARNAARVSGLFGRYTGTSPDQIASLYGSMYQATGNETSADATINVISKAMKRGLDTAKVPELLQVVTRNTQLTASAMGGAAVSKDQQAMISAFSAMAMLQKDAGLSHFAKSQTFGNIMQNGFKGAGSQVGDLMIFKALGGFEGRMDLDKLFDMQQLRAQGPMMRPDILGKLVAGMPGTTHKQKAGFMGEAFKEWGMSPDAAIKMQELMETDLFKRMTELKPGEKISAKDQKEWEQKVASLPGMSKQAREAKLESLHLEAGEKINEMLGGLEEAALNMTKSILHTQSAEDLVSAVKSFSNSMESVSKYLEHPDELSKKMMKGAIGWDDNGTSEKILSYIWGKGDDYTQGASPAHNKGGSSGGWGDASNTESSPAGQKLRDFWQRTKDRFGFRDTSALKSKADFYASKYGVDNRLFRGLIEQESQWNPNAVSRTGAAGLGQLTASAGHYKKGQDNPFDPDFNLDKSAKHFSYLLKKYKGNSQKALAAYNAGDGTVDLAIKKYGAGWLAHMNEFKYGQDAQGHVKGALRYAGMQGAEPIEAPQMASSHDVQTVTLDLMLKELRVMNANLSRSKLVPSHSRT